LKKILFISLAVVLALSVGLVGCSGGAIDYDLIIADTTGGSVTPAAGTHSYAQGEEIQLKAVADEYYKFVNWTGDTADIADPNAATTKITMNGDCSVTANFELLPWTSTIELAFHCTIPTSASVWTYVYAPWAGNVSADSGPDGGKIKFNFTYGSAPYTAEDSLTAISNKVVDLGQLSGDTFSLGSIGYLPFVFPNMKSAAYATHKLYQTEIANWDPLGELDNVRVLITSPLQPAQWWGNLNVTKLSDLAGVDVRCEDAEVPTIEALGANPIVLDTADLYSNLDTGTVQGCFFTYSGGAFSFALKDVCSYVSEVNLLPRVYMLAMNKEVYDGLHPDARALLDKYSTAEWSANLAVKHEAAQAGAKGYIQNVPPKRPIYIIPPAEIANWKTATAGVAPAWVAHMTSLGFEGQALYDRLLQLIAATPS
jgi:TRAP-type C4-dicarboxylate transport system substrate-binding protein